MKNETKPRRSKTKFRKILVWIVGLLAGLLLLVLILLLAAPALLKGFANSGLDTIPGAETSLERVGLNLPRGRAELQGLTIQQPAGFEDEALLELGQFSVAVPLVRAFKQDPLTVNHLRVSDLTLRVISNADGILNVTQLAAKDGEDTLGEAEPDDTTPGQTPPIWIREILLSNLKVVYNDLAQNWNLEIKDINVELHDLKLAGTATDEQPAILNASLAISGPRVDALVRLRGKIGMINPNQPDQVPAMQIAMALIGFDLDIVRPFLVTGARTALGGNGIDFILLTSIGPGDAADQSIQGEYALLTDNGHRYAAALGGTVANPRLPFLNLLGDVIGNQFGRVTRLGGNLAQGSVSGVHAIADTGGAAVSGAASTVTGVAGGAWRTLRGVATLDAGETLGGLRDTTVGTVTNLTETVTSTVGTAYSGVGRTAGIAMGADDVRHWWENLDERISAFEQIADNWFDEIKVSAGESRQ